MSLLLMFFACMLAVSSYSQESFVCYSDAKCGVEIERPVFYLGNSVDDCCAKPNVLSASTNDECFICGFSAERVSPKYVALHPPDDLELEVTVTGYETVTWLINGTVMHDFERLLLQDNNQKLVLTNTSTEDYGTYTADIYTLENETQVIMIDFFVDKYVSSSVHLSHPPESEIKNSQLAVTCSASGNPIPDVSVYCDNEITITSVGNATINDSASFGELPDIIQTVYVVASGLDGIKQCHCNTSAFDGEGNDVKMASAIILPVPARVLSFQPDQTVTITAPLKTELSCSGRGRPAPTVTWYKGHEQIANDTNYAFDESVKGFEISSSLVIFNTSSTDYGHYHCEISNLYGEENSTAVLIDIQFPPNVSTSTPAVTVNTNIHKEVTLHCQARANPEAQIIWLVDGEILNDKCGPQGTLYAVFGEAELEYEDFYSDQNGDGYVPGSCEITITRDTSDEGILVTESSLTLRNLDQENNISSKTFKCIAQNNVIDLIGVKQYANSILELEDAPYFLQTPLSSYNLKFEELYTFHCDVIGKSSPTVTWLKDGDTLLDTNPNLSIISTTEGNVTNSTLTVISTGQNDQGIYTCKAESSDTDSLYEFSVDIHGVLVIHDTSGSYGPYMAGEIAILSCNVTSSNNASISWSHLGVILVEDNRISITTDANQLTDWTSTIISTLTVSELILADDGEYKCQATDPYSTVEQDIASIVVNVPVNVTVSPSNAIHVNETATNINCIATGFPQPTVQFINVTCDENEFLGEAIESRESGDFSIYCFYETREDGLYVVTAMATVEHSSKYGVTDLLCSSNNTISYGIDNGKFIVEALPAITSMPFGDIDLPIKESISLSCNATGYPAPTIMWTLNDVHITGVSTSDHFVLDNGLVLVNSYYTVNNASVADEGSYVCLFTNDAGNSSLNIATINIQALPTLDNFNKSLYTHIIGAFTTVDCTGHGHPVPTVTFHGLTCSNSEFHNIETEDGLFIGTCISEEDEDGVSTVTISLTVSSTIREYKGPVELVCMINNTLGSAPSQLVTVDLTGPPKVADLPQTVSVQYGGSLSLECSVSGYPLPSVVWAFNDVANIVSSVVEIIDEFTVISRLNVTHFYPNNDGTYYCIADNEHYNDTVTSSVVVTVDGVPPQSSSDNSDYVVTKLAGSTVMFFCNASGFPAPNITWYRSDIMDDSSGFFSEDDSDVVEIMASNPLFEISTTLQSVDDQIAQVFSTLTIDSVGLLDEAFYSCKATSMFGEVVTYAGVLLVEESPSVQLSHSSVTHIVPGENDTVITCTGTGKPSPLVEFGGLICSKEITENTQSVNGINTTCNMPFVNQQGLYYVTGTITITESVSVFGELSFPCLVQNGLMPNASETTRITINVKETVAVSPTSIAVNESDSFTLHCVATGHPFPIIGWIAGTELVIESDKYVLNEYQSNAYTVTSTLTVLDSQPDNTKEYRCRAESEGFQVESSFVSVIPLDECSTLKNPCNNNGICTDGLKKYSCSCYEGFSGIDCEQDSTADIEMPMLVENPVNITEVVLLDGFSITCEATGNPEPTYYWYKDGILSYKDTGSELSISEAKPSDRGYYYCEARNDGGNSTSKSGLVLIQGLYQYITEIGHDSVFNANTTVDKMVTCLTTKSLPGFEFTKIYSLELCTNRRGCEHNGIAAVLITLYQTRMPYSHAGLQQALSYRLENIADECSVNVTITDVWRFDGCRETIEVLHPEYELGLSWPEPDIEDTIVRPCPCGSLSDIVYNETAYRQCGGDYTNGGYWLDSDTSLCQYNKINPNITLNLCHLTSVSSIDDLGESLQAVTMESSLFQSLDFTIASIVLEVLASSDDIATNERIQSNFVNCINNLLSVDRSVAADSESKHQSTTRVLEAVNTFQKIIETPENQTEVKFATKKIAFFIIDVPPSNFGNITLLVNVSDSDNLDLDNVQEQRRVEFNASLSLPATLIEEGNVQAKEDTLRLGYVVLTNDAFFHSSSESEYGAQLAEGNLTVGSIVVSASLFGGNEEIKIQDLSNPVVIEFRKPETLLVNKTDPFCVFWDSKSSDNGWSSEGCVLVETGDDNIVRCECTHLTHFGYLLDVQPLETEPDDLLGLEILIYILCIISVICLILTIITYCSSPKLRLNTQGKSIINMSIALIGVYVIYMIAVNAKAIRAIEGIRGDILCGFFGAVLYYFLLVYFMWTGLEAIDLYRKLVIIFNKHNKRLVIYGGIICWGMPLIFTVIAAVAGREDYISYEYFCRPVGPSFYVGFLVPFGLIYIFNWIVFTIIIGKFITRRAQNTDYKQSSSGLNYKKIFVVAMILSFNFGLGWIFGLLVTSEFPEPLYITFVVLFSLFVSLQGVLIFFLHCVRNQTARHLWTMWFYVVFCCQNVRDAKILSQTSHMTGMTLGMTPRATPRATPAMRRKNTKMASPGETSMQMQPITSLAQKYCNPDSLRGSVGSPLNDFDTMETFIGLPSPMNDSEFFTDEIDIGKDIIKEKEQVERKPSLAKRLSKRISRHSKTDVSEEMLVDDVEKGREMSKQESKKSLSKRSKKGSKKAHNRMEEVKMEDEFGGSTYSLESGSQVLEIQFKPDDHQEDEDSDEEEWRRLKEQFRDINNLLNPSFLGEGDQPSEMFY